MAHNKDVIVSFPKGAIPDKSGGKTYIYHIVEKVYRKDKKIIQMLESLLEFK